MCRPPSSFFTAHIDRYASLARCAYHKHKLPLFSCHCPCLTPTTLFIVLVLAHSSPLDIVCLSYHLLHASLSLYPSPRASFASNTHMHVYRSISQHIPRSTLTIPPHRSTYLTSYVSPFSDKGRLIFLCSYVCLPQPYRPPSSFMHAS